MVLATMLKLPGPSMSTPNVGEFLHKSTEKHRGDATQVILEPCQVISRVILRPFNSAKDFHCDFTHSFQVVYVVQSRLEEIMNLYSKQQTLQIPKN